MAWPTQAEVDAYVRSRAPAFNIDPNAAVAVRQAESKAGFVGDSGSSFGPFQLHLGGLATGDNSGPGLGDTFKQRTGLDPRNPDTWKQQVDFALGEAAKVGWEPFHAAKQAGIGLWEGIKTAFNGVASGLYKYWFPLAGYTGNVRETYHTSGAVDLFAPAGTAVRNIVKGVVKGVGTSGPGGNSILIRGDDGKDYYYAHFAEKVSLAVGDIVDGGQTIGKVGDTGNAKGTGTHVHIGAGYGIQEGTGPTGGAGIGFDFQGFLDTVLKAGGSAVDIPGAIAAVNQTLNPGNLQDVIVRVVDDFRKRIYQSIVNWTGSRAAAIVILGSSILLIIFGLNKMIADSGIVKGIANVAASRYGVGGQMALASVEAVA